MVDVCISIAMSSVEMPITSGYLAWGGCVGESILWRASVRLRREDGNPCTRTNMFGFYVLLTTRLGHGKE